VAVAMSKRSSQSGGKGHRVWALAQILLAAVALTLLAAPAPAGAEGARRAPAAHIARTLNSTETAHLHYMRSSGSLLYEEGSVSGALKGSMRADLNVGPTFTGTFTIYTRYGAIRGHGTATPHGSGRYESFGGILVVTGGTGRYIHARGRAGLYGTFDRRTYAMVVQTTGRLSY
jgi:hypothetical protein